MFVIFHWSDVQFHIVQRICSRAVWMSCRTVPHLLPEHKKGFVVVMISEWWFWVRCWSHRGLGNAHKWIYISTFVDFQIDLNNKNHSGVKCVELYFFFHWKISVKEFLLFSGIFSNTLSNPLYNNMNFHILETVNGLSQIWILWIVIQFYELFF